MIFYKGGLICFQPHNSEADFWEFGMYVMALGHKHRTEIQSI